jgi:hypothetical protein
VCPLSNISEHISIKDTGEINTLIFIQEKYIRFNFLNVTFMSNYKICIGTIYVDI